MDEVRKLAEQSQTAATQIIGLIQVNSSDIADAVNAVKEANTNITTGIKSVYIAGEQFRSIAQIAKEVRGRAETVSQSVLEVVHSSFELSQVSKELGHVVEATAAQSQNVSAATEEQLASMEEIAAASEALAILAQDMSNVVGKFRVR